MEKKYLKDFHSDFLTWQCLLLHEILLQHGVTSVPFKESNSGAEALALPAHPLPIATLATPGSLEPHESHRGQPGTTQPLSRGWAGAQVPTVQDQGASAATTQEWASSPSSPQAQKERIVPPCHPTLQSRSHASSPMHCSPGPSRPALPRLLRGNRLERKKRLPVLP